MNRLSTGFDEVGTRCVELQLVKVQQRAAKLEAQLAETTKAYETVKAWGHRVSGSFETLLDKCCDYADGTPDSTELAKFCNEMIGMSNAISLGDIQTLRSERDALKAQLSAPRTKMSFEEWWNEPEKFAPEPLHDFSRRVWVAALENLDIASIIWPVVKAEDVEDGWYILCGRGEAFISPANSFSGEAWSKSGYTIHGPISLPTKGVE